jgi:MoaA/NifB/PqqE/SkfB family radical SAM enzyme
MAGDVYPCSFVYKSGADYVEWYMGQELMVPETNFRMGNIFERDFSEIWNGKAYRELRRKVLSLRDRKRLTPAELNERRRSVKKDSRFWYCDVCLARWTAAC